MPNLSLKSEHTREWGWWGGGGEALIYVDFSPIRTRIVGVFHDDAEDKLRVEFSADVRFGNFDARSLLFSFENRRKTSCDKARNCDRMGIFVYFSVSSDAILPALQFIMRVRVRVISFRSRVELTSEIHSTSSRWWCDVGGKMIIMSQFEISLHSMMLCGLAC